MVIPYLNPVFKGYVPQIKEPQEEEKEPFLDAYMHALSNVKEEARQMMISKNKNERRDGIKLYSAISEFIAYLEQSSKDVESILRNESLMGRDYPTYIERTLEERIKTEAHFTRNGRTALQRAVADIKKRYTN